MRKQFIGLAILVAANLAFAGGVVIPITFYNYTSTPGLIFIGTSPQVVGPPIGNEGNAVQWSPVVNGIQPVGLQIGPGPADEEMCFLIGGPLVLNPALFKAGDTVSIVYGQPQFPTGITCGCFGSAACATG